MIKQIVELSKIRITFFVMLSTAFGYLCSAGIVDAKGMYASIGIFFLACAAAVLNHIQEIPFDRKMNRTRLRPLPSGTVGLEFAAALVVLYLFAGSLILLLFVGVLPFLTGFSALVWYNVIYTPMKQMNYFAVIPGAVIGAIPPVAGWVSSGGSFTDPRLWVIAFFFFIWQIPHFWLLLLLYRNDYERAGFPTLFQKFALPQVKRLTFLSIALTGIAGLLFPIFSLLSFKLLNLAILFSSLIFLLYKSIGLLQRQTHAQTIRFMFKGINFYVLVVVIIVSIDKIKLIFIYR